MNKPMFVWTDLLNSPLIKTQKKDFIGFAGFNSAQNAFVSCVFRQLAKGNEIGICKFGPFGSLDEACTAVEKYIAGQLVFNISVPEVQLN